MIIQASDEDAFIMGLAENIARHSYRPLEILADIGTLLQRGHGADSIVEKTGLSPKYVKDIVYLLEQGEGRLIDGVKSGKIPLTTALEIARAKQADDAMGNELQTAYESGQLKGHQVTQAKRLALKAQNGKAAPASAVLGKAATTSYNLVRSYQNEVERQHSMVLKAEHAHQSLMLVVQGLRTLFTGDNFRNLLRAEGLDTLPKYLADHLTPLQGESA